MSEEEATILVVDDDEFTGELIGMALEMAGYETIIAQGGMEALEKLAENAAIRVVVSDMNMPFLTGVQLFAELREQGYTQPFVLLSGEDTGMLKEAHPDLDAVLAKDDKVQEALPELVASLLPA